MCPPVSSRLGSVPEWSGDHLLFASPLRLANEMCPLETNHRAVGPEPRPLDTLRPLNVLLAAGPEESHVRELRLRHEEQSADLRAGGRLISSYSSLLLNTDTNRISGTLHVRNDRRTTH